MSRWEGDWRAAVAAAALISCGENRIEDAAAPTARTVSVGLGSSVEWRIEEEGAPPVLTETPLDGVQVCAVERRGPGSLFEPFEPLLPPFCAPTSERALHAPARSDLVLTATKSGYLPATRTFRTDDFDARAPYWVPDFPFTLARDGALQAWVEGDPSEDGGLVAVEAYALWFGRGVAPAEAGAIDPVFYRQRAPGVTVEIARSDGSSVATLVTLADRPRFISLSEGEYRFRFRHPSRRNVMPLGARERYQVGGLGTNALDTVEVPVRAGHLGFAAIDVACVPPRSGERVHDYTTCELSTSDAGAD